jgi:hypothetical protein
MVPFSFENKKAPIARSNVFYKRLLFHLSICFLLVIISLLIGTYGYSFYGELSLIDGFYNASMILTGMGPVNPMKTSMSKLFSSIYALYSGLVFLSMIALIITPIFHRVMHILHFDEEI